MADEHLMLSGIWFAEQSRCLRENFDMSNLNALGGRLSTILAIATLNREYVTADDLAQEAMTHASDSGALAMDHLADQPLAGGYPGQQVSSSAYIEAAIDGAESWLFDALRLPVNGDEPPADLAPLAILGAQRYSIQHALNDMWNQAAWEGWHLVAGDEDALVWSPSDKKLATLVDACRVRQESNFMNYPWIDMSAWVAMKPEGRQRLALKRSVVEVSTRKGRRRIKVARPSCLSRRPPLFVIERGGLEGCYLARFLDRTFPSDVRITCRLLLQAWHVIHDLVQLLMKPLPRPTSLNPAEVERLALLVARRELVSVVSRALDVDEEAAKLLIEFLSFKPRAKGDKGNRGLWAAPVVPVPGTDLLAFALPALATSNAIRKCEAWMERGGLDDNLSRGARGDLYETEFRQEIRKALTQNSLLTDARCAKHSIKKDADFGEQIDLLIQLGSLLIVGEVKCFLSPADSIERFRYFKKLKAASSQARSKAALLGTRPDVVARALEITEERARQLRVLPIVVTNQGFGFSLDVGGCRVVEAGFLKSYLGAGKLVTEMAIDPRSGHQSHHSTVFYRDQAEAEREFEATMANPIILRRFIDRLSWTRSKFPTSFGTPFYVDCTQLGDISGAQRLRAGALSAVLER